MGIVNGLRRDALPSFLRVLCFFPLPALLLNLASCGGPCYENPSQQAKCEALQQISIVFKDFESDSVLVTVDAGSAYLYSGVHMRTRNCYRITPPIYKGSHEFRFQIPSSNLTLDTTLYVDLNQNLIISYSRFERKITVAKFQAYETDCKVYNLGIVVQTMGLMTDSIEITLDSTESRYIRGIQSLGYPCIATYDFVTPNLSHNFVFTMPDSTVLLDTTIVMNPPQSLVLTYSASDNRLHAQLKSGMNECAYP